MWTLFFDIDGTLLSTGGAGWIAIRRAMGEIYGVTELPKIPVGGRTDRGIFRDLFIALGLDESEPARNSFVDLYHQYLPETLPQTEPKLYPGVRELLAELSVRPDVAVGLLTGNSETAAKAKVDHFELGGYFTFGGYGDDHSERNLVAEQAVEDATAICGPIQLSKAWVIGDTVHDIDCARHIGAKVVAVNTGSGAEDELRDRGPDLWLDDLSNWKKFIDGTIS